MPRPTICRSPIRPDRVRRIDGSFAFIPHRLLRDGFLSSLTADESRLYLFLVLASDRQGLSFYHFDRICSILELDIDRFLEARDGLIAKDLLALEGSRLQVLSLPASPAARLPIPARRDCDDLDPAFVRSQILASLRDSGLK